MKVLLDSNAYSLLMRGHEEVAKLVRRAEEVLFSAVVVGELMYGFRRGTRFERNAADLRSLLDSPYSSFVDVGAGHRGPLLQDSRGIAGERPPHSDQRCLDRRPRDGDRSRPGFGG